MTVFSDFVFPAEMLLFLAALDELLSAPPPWEMDEAEDPLEPPPAEVELPLLMLPPEDTAEEPMATAAPGTAEEEELDEDEDAELTAEEPTADAAPPPTTPEPEAELAVFLGEKSVAPPLAALGETLAGTRVRPGNRATA